MKKMTADTKGFAHSTIAAQGYIPLPSAGSNLSLFDWFGNLKMSTLHEL
jgi:hypothetical protein